MDSRGEGEGAGAGGVGGDREGAEERVGGGVGGTEEGGGTEAVDEEVVAASVGG